MLLLPSYHHLKWLKENPLLKKKLKYKTDFLFFFCLPSYHHLKWLVYIVMHVLSHNDGHHVGIPLIVTE